MDEHQALNQLAQTPKPAPRLNQLPPSPVYDFEHLGNTLADSLSTAADDLVTEANRIAEHTRRLAADIRLQIAEQGQSLANINARLKASGEQMLEAHRKFNGS